MENTITKVIDLVPGKVTPILVIDINELDEDTFWKNFVCTHTPVIVKGPVTKLAALW
ncbi:MAG: hypothetical protein HRT38_19115 [Alteromonadaceae bacterium]|nr:hypothetical protein [Alteromonadaceae bacterium]